MHNLNNNMNSDKCVLCRSAEKDVLMFGTYHVYGDVSVHQNCLYLSSNLVQKGDDFNGIMRFLPADIKAEQNRTKNTTCKYCHKRGANIGCCNVFCQSSFHTGCGIKNGAQNQFHGTYNSYCHRHRKNYDLVPLDDADCAICLERLTAENEKPNLANVLPSICCENGWYHKECLQQYAFSAGYFFKCPLCNNTDKFRQVTKWGIAIPDRDASWELEPNAYDYTNRTQVLCTAVVCVHPAGRSSGPESLRLCTRCAANSVHVECSGGGMSGIVQCTDCRFETFTFNSSDSDQYSDPLDLPIPIPLHRAWANRNRETARQKHQAARADSIDSSSDSDEVDPLEMFANEKRILQQSNNTNTDNDTNNEKSTRRVETIVAGESVLCGSRLANMRHGLMRNMPPNTQHATSLNEMPPEGHRPNSELSILCERRFSAMPNFINRSARTVDCTHSSTRELSTVAIENDQWSNPCPSENAANGNVQNKDQHVERSRSPPQTSTSARVSVEDKRAETLAAEENQVETTPKHGRGRRSCKPQQIVEKKEQEKEDAQPKSTSRTTLSGRPSRTRARSSINAANREVKNKNQHVDGSRSPPETSSSARVSPKEKCTQTLAVTEPKENQVESTPKQGRGRLSVKLQGIVEKKQLEKEEADPKVVSRTTLSGRPSRTRARSSINAANREVKNKNQHVDGSRSPPHTNSSARLPAKARRFQSNTATEIDENQMEPISKRGRPNFKPKETVENEEQKKNDANPKAAFCTTVGRLRRSSKQCAYAEVGDKNQHIERSRSSSRKSTGTPVPDEDRRLENNLITAVPMRDPGRPKCKPQETVEKEQQKNNNADLKAASRTRGRSSINDANKKVQKNKNKHVDGSRSPSQTSTSAHAMVVDKPQADAAPKSEKNQIELTPKRVHGRPSIKRKKTLEKEQQEKNSANPTSASCKLSVEHAGSSQQVEDRRPEKNLTDSVPKRGRGRLSLKANKTAVRDSDMVNSVTATAEPPNASGDRHMEEMSDWNVSCVANRTRTRLSVYLNTKKK